MSRGRAQYCSFEVGGQRFGVAIEEVQEVVDGQAMTAVPLAPKLVRGLINLRGEIVPALDLRVGLGLEPRAEGAANLVLRRPSGLVGLLVDEIGEVMEIADREIEARPPGLDEATATLIRGVHVCAEGLLLILEVEGLEARLGAAASCSERRDDGQS